MSKINNTSVRAWVALFMGTLLLVLVWQHSEAASGTTLTVINQSNRTICKLYITPNLNAGLQGEQLSGGSMKHWARRAFSIEGGHYDVVVMDCGNREISRWRGADLTTAKTWKVTQEKVVTQQKVLPQQRQTDQPIVVGTNDSDWDGIPDSADECVGAKETPNGIFDGDGCPDTIDDLLEYAIGDIDGYWKRIFANSGLTYRPPANVDLSWRTDYLAYYDPGPHTIALSRVFATEAVANIGDFAPVVALAHEWGHLVQLNLHLLGGGYSTRTLELQADCFAGAYTRDAESRGQLDEDDAQEGAQLLIGLGDNLPHNHPQAHGSGNERVQAYHLGYGNGPRSCMNYTTR